MQKYFAQIKKYASLELILLLCLGVCVGFYAKRLAQEHMTMGHHDPAIAVPGMVYDIDRLEQELIAEGIPRETPTVPMDPQDDPRAQ